MRADPRRPLWPVQHDRTHRRNAGAVQMRRSRRQLRRQRSSVRGRSRPGPHSSCNGLGSGRARRRWRHLGYARASPRRGGSSHGMEVRGNASRRCDVPSQRGRTGSFDRVQDRHGFGARDVFCDRERSCEVRRTSRRHRSRGASDGRVCREHSSAALRAGCEVCDASRPTSIRPSSIARAPQAPRRQRSSGPFKLHSPPAAVHEPESQSGCA